MFCSQDLIYLELSSFLNLLNLFRSTKQLLFDCISASVSLSFFKYVIFDASRLIC